MTDMTDDEINTLAMRMAREALQTLADDSVGLGERLGDRLDGLSEDEMNAQIERLRKAIQLEALI